MTAEERHLEGTGNGFWRKYAVELFVALLLGAYGFTSLSFGYTYAVDQRSVKRDEMRLLQGQVKEIQTDVRQLVDFLIKERGQ